MPKTTPKTRTAATMTPADIPEGMVPEQFLGDADLLGYYQRQLDALPADDPGRAEVKRAVKYATRAAAMTAAAVEEANDEAAAELAAAG